MKICVDHIPDEGLELDYNEAADSFDYLKEEGESGAKIVGPVSVAIRARKESGGITIHGRLQGAAVIHCGRCLEEFSEDISHDFSYNCLPQQAMEGEKEELSMESADVCYYSGGDIDVTAIVQEQVSLALPMRPLCREDCKGLCPKCGANLNKGECGCKNENVDLRLAALKNIRF